MQFAVFDETPLGWKFEIARKKCKPPLNRAAALRWGMQLVVDAVKRDEGNRRAAQTVVRQLRAPKL